MWKRTLSQSLHRTRGKPSLLPAPFPSTSTANDHLLLTKHKQVGGAGEAAVADAAAQVKLAKAAAAVVNPRVIFPWRHEDYPLPRLINGSDEYVAQGGKFGPGMPYLDKMHESIVTHFTGNQMGTPWYKIPFNGWKQDLAESSSWAFSQAVAGMLANNYRIPFEDIRQDDEDGEFDVNLPKHTMTTQSLYRDDGEEDVFPELEYMVEEKLRALYQSAHEFGRDQMQIELQMKPTGAWLLGSFMVPFLTREKVKAEPALKTTYRDIYARILEEEDNLGREISFFEIGKLVSHEIRLLGRDQAELLDDHMSLKSTIVAQVLIECDEIFSVTDLTTGKIIQGDGELRRVPHVVRLEVVVDTQKEYGKRGSHNELGSWQITDWDDLLEGNIWYL
jgi:hypothetical protein